MDCGFPDTEPGRFPTSPEKALCIPDRAAVGSGDTVQFKGASGRAGSALVQMAKLRGACVDAMCSAKWAGLVVTRGADAVIPRRPDKLRNELAIPGSLTSRLSPTRSARSILPKLSVLSGRGDFAPCPVQQVAPVSVLNCVFSTSGIFSSWVPRFRNKAHLQSW